MFRIILSIFVTCNDTCVSVFNSRVILRRVRTDRDLKSAILEKKKENTVSYNTVECRLVYDYRTTGTIRWYEEKTLISFCARIVQTHWVSFTKKIRIWLLYAYLILSAMATVMHGVQGDKQPSASLRGPKRKLNFRHDGINDANDTNEYAAGNII